MAKSADANGCQNGGYVRVNQISMANTLE